MPASRSGTLCGRATTRVAAGRPSLAVEFHRLGSWPNEFRPRNDAPEPVWPKSLRGFDRGNASRGGNLVRSMKGEDPTSGSPVRAAGACPPGSLGVRGPDNPAGNKGFTQPMASDTNRVSSTLFRDLAAGLVVFLVALPLCLGVALASGAPLFSGLLAGIVGGIAVGLLSGSQTSVSGPAAGLTAIVAAQIASLGSFRAFLLALVLAGLIQVALGIARAGSIA